MNIGKIINRSSDIDDMAVINCSYSKNHVKRFLQDLYKIIYKYPDVKELFYKYFPEVFRRSN
jgi:hypothetical protein